MSQIHPSAVVSKDAKIADGVIIGPNCIIEKNVVLGEGCVLDANVYIYHGVKVGRNNHFYPNCVIGANPQVLVLKPDSIGGLVIGDNNNIREMVTLHKSMYPDHSTKLGNNNLLMVGVHFGHDVIVEDNVILSNYVQIGGHCHIKTGAWVAGMAAMHQFSTIGKWAYVAGFSGITHDIPSFLITCGHYPPVIRGINIRGMKRAGLSPEQQRLLIETYKKLYRRGGALLENAKELAAQDGLDPNVREMVDMIIKSSSHRFGRYLETLRH